jgi:hypothetical protein
MKFNLSKNDNQLDPIPDMIDTNTNKSMWIVNGYRVWADNYKQAVELAAIIDKF